MHTVGWQKSLHDMITWFFLTELFQLIQPEETSRALYYSHNSVRPDPHDHIEGTKHDLGHF